MGLELDFVQLRMKPKIIHQKWVAISIIGDCKGLQYSFTLRDRKNTRQEFLRWSPNEH